MARVTLIFSIALTIGSMITNLIAVAIPYWLYTEDPQLSYQGLWVRCPFLSGGNECKLFKLAPEVIDATRIMMLLGLSFYSMALLLSLTYLCCRQEKTKYSTAAIVFMVIGGVFCMIAVIVYGAKSHILLGAETQRLHAGFGLAVISGLSGFVTAFFYCVSRHRDE